MAGKATKFGPVKTCKSNRPGVTEIRYKMPVGQRTGWAHVVSWKLHGDKRHRGVNTISKSTWDKLKLASMIFIGMKGGR